MAGSAVIGSLRVNLGIDSATFDKGVKHAQSSLGRLAGTLKSFAIGAVAALSFGAVTRVITSIIDKADELGKAAQKIGIPVEALSKLEYAARLADVSFEQLSVGVARLSKNMAQIAIGKGGDAASAMRAIGVSALTASGQLRPTTEVISDIAEKFAAMKDGAGKTALAIAIFGKSGAELIPLLNAGKTGLAESSAELERFGGVITGPMAQAAEQFNDNLTRLWTAGQGLLIHFITPMIPKMAELTDRFVAFVKDGGSINLFLDEAAARFATTSREVDVLVKSFMTLQAIWTALNADTPGLIFDAEKTLEPFRKASEEIKDIWSGANDAIKATEQSVNRVGKVDLPAMKIEAPIFKPIDTASSVKALKDLKTAQDEVARSAQQVWEKTRTPLENYQIELRKLNDLMQAGAIDSDTYKRAVIQLQDQFSTVAESASTLGEELNEAFGSTLNSWIDQAVEGTFRLQDALDDLMKQLIKSGLQKLLASLLTGGSVAPSQQGGGGLFSKLFGFAHGGSFKVGGSGGLDSKLAAFRVTPGEQVDIHKPGNDNRGDAPKLEVNVMNMNGSNVRVEEKPDGQGGIKANVFVEEMAGAMGGNQRARRGMGLPPIMRRYA